MHLQSETIKVPHHYISGVLLGEILLVLNFVLIGPILITCCGLWVTLRYFLVKIENHGRSTLISPTAKLRVIFSWKLSQMPCGNHAIYHLIKGVSFQRECGATSMREYNKIILASSKWVDNVNWPPQRV